MTETLSVSREQATEIFQALNGIGALLKRLHTNTEDEPVIYAIMSNLALIQTNLSGTALASSN